MNGEVRYIRVTAKALKKGLVIKAPKRRRTSPRSHRRSQRNRQPQPEDGGHSTPGSFIQPLSIRRMVARFNSRSTSRFLMSCRLSNSTLPLPTARATLTLPFFQ